MNAKDYQAGTSKTAVYPTDRALEYLALGLLSEAGEVAGLLKRVIRDGVPDNFAERLELELGDVMWYIAQLCEVTRLDLGEVMQANLKKLADRQARGKLHGEGDKR